MKFYCLGGKSFETDFKNHMLSTKHNGLFQKKITIQGRDGRKVFIVLCTLRKLANSPNPPGKKPLSQNKYPFGLELSVSLRL